MDRRLCIKIMGIIKRQKESSRRSCLFGKHHNMLFVKKNQKTEVKLKCVILNKFLTIGMPETYRAS